MLSSFPIAAFVEYDDERDAQDAVRKLDGTRILHGTPPRRPFTTYLCRQKRLEGGIFPPR
jgi:hypothetical protein